MRPLACPFKHQIGISSVLRWAAPISPILTPYLLYLMTSGYYRDHPVVVIGKFVRQSLVATVVVATLVMFGRCTQFIAADLNSLVVSIIC